MRGSTVFDTGVQGVLFQANKPGYSRFIEQGGGVDQTFNSRGRKGTVVSIVGGPVLGDVKNSMRGWSLDEESTEEDAFYFVRLYQIENEMHVFREGDKARVLEVGPGCFRLFPFDDTRESFWV